tara:strand:- start:214 stop:801 length:588 start_codon:yes stop_codon:yes gene_type:complete
MTAISPLESIHKKGLFGNHHKKNESDLTQILEIKNLAIIQVVQYKKSKIEIKDISIDGIKFPNQALLVNSNNDTRFLWMGPKNWIIVSTKDDIRNLVEKSCNDKNFAVTDISHSRAIIQIKGSNAIEILKKGCPINFNNFKKNNCAGTVFQGINILVDMISDEPKTVNLFALRSFGESFYHDITDAALEDGYIGI